MRSTLPPEARKIRCMRVFFVALTLLVWTQPRSARAQATWALGHPAGEGPVADPDAAAERDEAEVELPDAIGWSYAGSGLVALGTVPLGALLGSVLGTPDCRSCGGTGALLGMGFGLSIATLLGGAIGLGVWGGEDRGAQAVLALLTSVAGVAAAAMVSMLADVGFGDPQDTLLGASVAAPFAPLAAGSVYWGSQPAR